MVDLTKIFLYRITHIENISHILEFGITHHSSPNANPVYKSIGDPALIRTRNTFTLRNGRKLGDYIPFYFGGRMPMLYVLQHGRHLVARTPAEEIVYCICSVQRIVDQRLDFIFTNGHAVNQFSSQYFSKDVDQLDQILDFKAIREKYWKPEKDLDLKRRKEAEFLVLGDIFPETINGYLVFNEWAKNKIVSLGANPKIVLVKPDLYF